MLNRVFKKERNYKKYVFYKYFTNNAIFLIDRIILSFYFLKNIMLNNLCKNKIALPLADWLIDRIETLDKSKKIIYFVDPHSCLSL